jgi:hypothetical protein
MHGLQGMQKKAQKVYFTDQKPVGLPLFMSGA